MCKHSFTVPSFILFLDIFHVSVHIFSISLINLKRCPYIFPTQHCLVCFIMPRCFPHIASPYLWFLPLFQISHFLQSLHLTYIFLSAVSRSRLHTTVHDVLTFLFLLFSYSGFHASTVFQSVFSLVHIKGTHIASVFLLSFVSSVSS